MTVTVNDDARRHIEVCERFTDAVVQARDQFGAATPCPDWDVRAVVEHVIGFHDVLLLRPLQAKPTRPRDDPVQRWVVTVEALKDVLVRPGLFDSVVAIPAVGDNAPTQLDARTLVPMLTQDVLVHTWDVARAIGADDRLDETLCAAFLARLPDDDRLQRGGTFGPAVAVPDGADAQSRLLGRLGRDAAWTGS